MQCKLLFGLSLAVLAVASYAGALARPLHSSPAGTRGREVFELRCAMCHADSALAPGTMALGQRVTGIDRVLERRRGGLSADYVRQVVRTGLDRMPPISRVELGDTDVDAVADYLASAEKHP